MQAFLNEHACVRDHDAAQQTDRRTTGVPFIIEHTSYVHKVSIEHPRTCIHVLDACARVTYYARYDGRRTFMHLIYHALLYSYHRHIFYTQYIF